MSEVKIVGMSTDDACHLQRGGVDANGHAPERTRSNGDGNPCWHCLEFIAEGEEMLIVSYRPFSTIQP